MSNHTRGHQLASALQHLADARELLTQIDLRSCNNDLRGNIKDAQEGIHQGVTSLEHALRSHLQQEKRKATP